MTFSDLFGLVIPFDGSDEMNISLMLFDNLYQTGIMVQSASHGSKEMSNIIKQFCSGSMFYTATGKSETVIGMVYNE